MAIENNEKFAPAWWLPSCHLQTIFPTLIRRKIHIPLTRERLELPDGDFIDLDWSGQGNGPLAIILHGLGGSIDSPYAKGIVKAINQQGWRSVFIHFRGCSGVPNRLPRSYHSGETSDADYVVKELRKREPNTLFVGIGFSLGGSVLLKWLGETGIENPLAAAVAVSVPFDLHKASLRMQRGLSRGYQWWLLKHLRKTVSKKIDRVSMPIERDELNELKDFWNFDEKVTAPLHGFASAFDYYTKCSSRQFLSSIEKPTLVLHSADDPFMTKEVIPDYPELSNQVELEVYPHGGHVGFISGTIPGKPKYWLEHRIPQYLSQFTD